MSGIETSFDRLNSRRLEGETDAAFAQRLGVSPSTFHKWKKVGKISGRGKTGALLTQRLGATSAWLWGFKGFTTPAHGLEFRNPLTGEPFAPELVASIASGASEALYGSRDIPWTIFRVMELALQAYAVGAREGAQSHRTLVPLMTEGQLIKERQELLEQEANAQTPLQ